MHSRIARVGHGTLLRGTLPSVNPVTLMDGSAPFYFPGNRTGCLLIHGYTGNPSAVRWLGEYLNQQSYTVYAPRLAGHGTTPEAMLGIRWQEWYADVLAGYELLHGSCDRVFAVGLSMGGSLSLILASQQPVTGVIALSTPHRIADPRLPLIPLVGRVWRFRDKSQYKETAQQFRQHVIEEQRRRGEPEHGHRSYSRYPLTSILELNGALVAMRKALPLITSPSLFIMSSQDDVVGMKDLHRNLSLCANEDKRTLILGNSFHGITEDIERETVFKAVADFVAEFSQ